MSDLQILKERIRIKHQGDVCQLDVIFTNSKKILVEAPAGYGKTNTMVSKIAYMICTQQIPNPKRLLALTFSVNAAYKIKRDILANIPVLLEHTTFDNHIAEKVYVSNYHGFCRNVLKKYGRVYHSTLCDIDTLQSIDDSNIKSLRAQVPDLPSDLAEFLSIYSESIKEIDKNFLEANLIQYNDIIRTYLLPNGLIPYNGILTLTIQLFDDYPKALSFYQKYFKAILVDEFQDTNIISFWLLNKLITAETKLILLGDSLQRIYGFIGAVPDLLNIAVQQFNLETIVLNKNYRFSSNQQMLLLDYNIRQNAINSESPNITTDATVDLFVANDQEQEAQYIVDRSLNLLAINDELKIAILTKQRGPNLDKIVACFDSQSISYFNALFTDDDQNYIQFHKTCLYEFINAIRINDSITKRFVSNQLHLIEEIFLQQNIVVYNSLITLLRIFWNKIISDYRAISNEEKIILIKDTFEHNGLKQYLEYINSRIVISTVHASKGLEWDFVILPDMEQDLFPSYFGICGRCNNRNVCNLTLSKTQVPDFLEELSVFYVAVTRAKKQVFFTASTQQEMRMYSSKTKNLSCFLSLPGIVPV